MAIVKKEERAPAKAFYFTQEADQIGFSEGEDKKKSLTIEPLYSGGPVDHWWFGKVIIDLSTMIFRGRRFPVLRDHSTDRILGHSGRPEIVKNADGKSSIHLTNVKLVDTEDTQKVIKLGDDGFPLQASISIKPTKVQRLDENEEAEINGFKVKGPLAIWKDCIYKEGSVCVFGVDSDTATNVFSDEEKAALPQVAFSYLEEGNEHQPQPEEKAMPFDPTAFKDDPAFAAFVEATKKEAAAPVTASLSATEQALAAKDKQIGELSEANTGLNTRLGEVEKTLTKFSEVAKEKALSDKASAIVGGLLAKTSFSDRQKGRVSKALTGYDAFVKEDVLDEAAFSAAVQTDIDGWAADFAEMDKESRVQGGGSAPIGLSGSTPGSTPSADFFSTEATAKRMAEAAGFAEPASAPTA